MYSQWFSISDRWAKKNQRLHALFTAWANLNSASRYMETYLCTGKKEDLTNAKRKLQAVAQTLREQPQAEENHSILSGHVWGML